MDIRPLDASRKSASIDSLASSCPEVRVTQTRLFDAIDAGDEETIVSLLENEDREESLRDAILLTKIPNLDGKYRHDPELHDANELLGPR
jgi:hypothetical protein